MKNYTLMQNGNFVKLLLLIMLGQIIGKDVVKLVIGGI